MRTLSTSLTNAQTTFNYSPLWKVVLSRSAQSTRGYDRTRILKIRHTEESDGQDAEVILNNSDTTLQSIDFEHFQMVLSYGIATGTSRSTRVSGSAYALDDIVVPASTNGYQYRCAIAGTTAAGTAQPTWPTALGVTVADSSVTWEMDGNTGDEYSYCAPLRVRYWETQSGMGILKCYLHATGIPNQMAEDEATAEYNPTQDDVQVAQTLMIAIAGTTLAPYGGYTAITMSFDSTDGIINTFAPKQAFSVHMNETRWSKMQALLDFTGCKMRPQNDGKLHVFDPTISGTVYNYEYKFNVASNHTFFSKSVRERFVIPNKVIVQSYPTVDPIYSSSATSATSFALDPKVHTTYAPVTSTAIASSIASAMIERYELDAEKGTIIVPMNVGQEIWDYVKVTDSRQGDTRTGNIQYLQRNVEVPIGQNKGLIWNTVISFGRISTESLMASLITAAGTTLSGGGGGGGGGDSGRMTNQQILSLYDNLLSNFRILVGMTDTLTDDVKTLYDAHNNLVEAYNAHFDAAVFRKLTVLDTLIIPSGST